MAHSDGRSIFSFFLIVEKNSSVLSDNFCQPEQEYADNALRGREKDRMMLRMKKRIFSVAVSRCFVL